LNHGQQLAKGRYVLLTDDDCTVDPGWICAAVRTLEADSRIGCVFGDVDASPHDSSEGYIPICRITKAHAIFSLSALETMPGGGSFGMGANMALRADALSRIGGWDPSIGPGAAFRSGDDNDVAVRILGAGYGIAFCPSARVIHHGFRLWESMSRDNDRYGFGMGAIFAKHLRCGTYYHGALRLPLDRLLISLRRLWLGQRPLALGYPRSWFRGFAKALLHPLDRQTQCFVADKGASGSAGNRVAEVVLRHQQDDDQVRARDGRRRSHDTDA
jgi:GT2 family glycosyltransferase